METIYLIIIIALFILAISDLVVGVSNDAVNFLNSAIGSKASSFRIVMLVAGLGVLAGATFSSGMMEVARKGIFHPQLFMFSEIILLFLAVMVTDVILLDAFNTAGMPTSTTVSIVFELLGAAVAISLIKVYTDPNALNFAEYINSDKALAIISGILLSVLIAFTAGVIFQYLTRLLFSFDYKKRLRAVGGIWGGIAITAITYFMLIKGVKGASFMTDTLKDAVQENALLIMGVSFLLWTVVLQLLLMFTKVDIFKLIVLVGTFALAMAFAGNDLVNFIGVPLAGLNSYDIYTANGGQDTLMGGLAGRVATPTLFLLIAGLIMVATLWTSKKARSVVQTSLDLGRQYEGSERFSSYAASRSIVRNFASFALWVNDRLPGAMRHSVERQFDQTVFARQQEKLGLDAPVFDMVRAAVTLVVASILISIGTALKLPLSTTYVTFMVFMGTSLADGAWGRESAVYRVSGVISVIGGWFFTAFAAFVVSFVIANVFYFGGPVAIAIVLLLTAFIIFRTHHYHRKKVARESEFAKKVERTVLTKAEVLAMSSGEMSEIAEGYGRLLDESLEALEHEDRTALLRQYGRFKRLERRVEGVMAGARNAIDRIAEDELEAGHFYILASDYLKEISLPVRKIVKGCLDHVNNYHKPLKTEQIQELRKVKDALQSHLSGTLQSIKDLNPSNGAALRNEVTGFIHLVREVRANQIRRLKRKDVSARNSVLYLHLLSEYRNIMLYSNRMLNIFESLVKQEIP